MKRFAIIGLGAITEEMLRSMEERGETASLAGVLVRPQRLPEAQRKAAGRFDVVDNVRSLLALGPEIVAECAGHGAMRQHGVAVVAQGVDLLCSSVGVLADAQFQSVLAKGPGRLW